jgi:hypothetical protein
MTGAFSHHVISHREKTLTHPKTIEKRQSEQGKYGQSESDWQYPFQCRFHVDSFRSGVFELSRYYHRNESYGFCKDTLNVL